MFFFSKPVNKSERLVTEKTQPDRFVQINTMDICV